MTWMTTKKTVRSTMKSEKSQTKTPSKYQRRIIASSKLKISGKRNNTSKMQTLVRTRASTPSSKTLITMTKTADKKSREGKESTGMPTKTRNWSCWLNDRDRNSTGVLVDPSGEKNKRKKAGYFLQPFRSKSLAQKITWRTRKRRRRTPQCRSHAKTSLSYRIWTLSQWLQRLIRFLAWIILLEILKLKWKNVLKKTIMQIS